MIERTSADVAAAQEKNCPRCAETIKQAAVVCRFCGHHFSPGPAAPFKSATAGTPLTSGQQVLLVSGLVIIVLLGLALMSGGSGTQEVLEAPSVDEASEAAASMPERALPIGPDGTVSAQPVTIRELVTAYAKNEAAAQETYGKRWLSVTGTIESVDLDFTDEPVVHFVGDVIPSPSARFYGPAQSQAAGLVKGRSVTLICGELSEFMGSPSLGDCEVENETFKTVPTDGKNPPTSTPAGSN